MLVCTLPMRFESETASFPHVPARTSCLWEHPGCLSTTCIVVGAVKLLWRQRRILSPLSLSPLPLRERIKKKKKSVSPHNSQFIQANVRQHFQVHSSSSRLCVRQIESEQQSTVGEVSQLLEVLALAGRLGLAQTMLYQVSQAQTAG